jgi:Asp-tRNA(Asn)/Glu-tRNA(Gln) amidotransferase A subunit family amidase
MMREAVDKAAARLRETGAEVRDALLTEMFGLAWPAHQIIFGVEGATFNAHRPAPANRPDGTAGVGDRRPASLIPATYYLQAQRIRQLLYMKVLSNFRDVDALLMPVAPAPAPKGLSSTGDASLLGPWSLLGYPAITINGGLSAEGLPLGLQFVAAPKQDYRLLQIGAWCEGALGRLPAPPLARAYEGT